jgi:hypothetical protein
MSKIFFDHTYTIDNDFYLFKKMESFGFSLSERISDHPDSKTRFIHFNNGKYLEFVKLTVPVKSWWYLSGLSFGVNESLKKFAATPRFKRFKPDYYHRNYNWRENNTDYLPGWNFLGFRKMSFRTFHPWLTEYEKGRSKVPTKVSHPNGVNEFHGHLFSINDQGREFFQVLFNKRIKDKIQLADGTWFYFKAARTSRHEAVLLKAGQRSNFEKFKAASSVLKTHGIEFYLFDYPQRFRNCWRVGVLSNY